MITDLLADSELTARVDSRTAALERAQTARDLWRRTNRDQEQAAIAEKAERKHPIPPASSSPTSTNTHG